VAWAQRAMPCQFSRPGSQRLAINHSAASAGIRSAELQGVAWIESAAPHADSLGDISPHSHPRQACRAIDPTANLIASHHAHAPRKRSGTQANLRRRLHQFRTRPGNKQVREPNWARTDFNARPYRDGAIGSRLWSQQWHRQEAHVNKKSLHRDLEIPSVPAC